MTIGDVILHSWSVAWRIALAVTVLQTILALVVIHYEGFPTLGRIPIDRALAIGFLAAAMRYQSAVALGIGCAIAGADLCMVIHHHIQGRHDAARNHMAHRLFQGECRWVPLTALVTGLSPIDQLFVMYWIARWCRDGVLESSDDAAADRCFRIAPPPATPWPDPPGAA